MLTVNVNPLVVESELAAGKIECQKCSGPLGGWGWAGSRKVCGVGKFRPRRGRCRACKATHVLLPASVLSRRAYSAQIIFGVLVLKARGWGHRRIGEALKLPVTTVREWIRRMGSRLDRARAVFRKIGREVRTDQPGEPEDGESRSLWQQMIDGLVQGIGQSPEHATGGDTDQQIIDVLLKAMSECENAEHTSGEGPAWPGGGGDVDQPGGEGPARPGGGGVVVLEAAGVAASWSHGQLLSPGWPSVVLAPVQHEPALM